MQKDTNFEHKEPKYAPPLRSEKRIGNTTFIVNSFFPEQVKDGVVSKIERLIKDDVKRKVTTI
ncbi:MAG: transposon-encoded TnpW family protein [Clostridia bacterium]|nr:transposon-encoded TnpW family protein [Clostridia bacterium]MBO5315230.1 transposon-encoded TnpW family protein [Clostridia bacterium]